MTGQDGITVGPSVQVGVVTIGGAVPLGSAVTVGASVPVAYGGAGGHTALGDLSDVDTTGEQPGDVLTFIGGVDLWEPRPPAALPTTHVVVDQVSPSPVWTVAHNLGYPPNIACFDSSGNPIGGVRDWPDPNPNTSTIRFYTGGIPAATSGQAVCS